MVSLTSQEGRFIKFETILISNCHYFNVTCYLLKICTIYVLEAKTLFISLNIELWNNLRQMFNRHNTYIINHFTGIGRTIVAEHKTATQLQRFRFIIVASFLKKGSGRDFIIISVTLSAVGMQINSASIFAIAPLRILYLISICPLQPLWPAI